MVQSPAENPPRGLRSITEDVFSLLTSMPKRTADHLRNVAGKKRRFAQLKNDEIRPETADAELSAPSYGETPVVQKRPASAPTTAIDETKARVLLTKDFLEEMALALQSHNDVERARFMCDESRRKLDTLKRKLQCLKEGTEEIRDWLIDNKQRLANREEDPEAESVKLEAEIAEYDQHLRSLEDGSQAVDDQLRSLEHSFARFSESSKELHTRIADELKTILKTTETPTMLTAGSFATKEVMDADLLSSWEKDYEEFIKGVFQDGGQRLIAGKYPSRPVDNCYEYCYALEFRRRDHETAVAKLAELEDAQKHGQAIDVDELQDQIEIVKITQAEFAEAIEGVRYAGVPCRSNGSLICNRIESDSDDFLWDPTTGEVYEGNFEDEMTAEELEAWVENSRGKTEDWLVDASLDKDPEQIGPMSPRTPGESNFNDNLQDVEAEDSISVRG